MTFGVQTRVSIWMLKERARTQRCSPQGASPSPSSGFLAPAQQNKDSFGYFPMQKGCRFFLFVCFFVFQEVTAGLSNPLAVATVPPMGSQLTSVATTQQPVPAPIFGHHFWAVSDILELTVPHSGFSPRPGTPLTPALPSWMRPAPWPPGAVPGPPLAPGHKHICPQALSPTNLLSQGCRGQMLAGRALQLGGFFA